MLSFLYQKYRLWIWLILFIMFETGAISKSYYAATWQVWLNAMLGVICLIIFLTITMRSRRTKTVGAANNEHEGKNVQPKHHGRLVLLFTVLGAVSATALLPYIMPVIESGMRAMPLPLAGKAAITVVQVTLLTLGASTLGLILASKVGLGAPLLHYWLYGGNKVVVSFPMARYRSVG